MVNILLIVHKLVLGGANWAARRFACIRALKSLNATPSRRSAIHNCWKSFVSRLVGEDSLTGFLFVYASKEAVVRNVDV